MVLIQFSIEPPFGVFPAGNLQQHHSISVRWKFQLGLHNYSKAAGFSRTSEHSLRPELHQQVLEQSES